MNALQQGSKESKIRLGVDKVEPKVWYKSSHMGPEQENSFKEGSRGQQYEKITVCDLETHVS